MGGIYSTSSCRIVPTFVCVFRPIRFWVWPAKPTGADTFAIPKSTVQTTEFRAFFIPPWKLRQLVGMDSTHAYIVNCFDQCVNDLPYMLIGSIASQDQTNFVIR